MTGTKNGKCVEKNRMTVEQLKKEIYYYSDIEPTDEEVEDIMYFYEQKPNSDLSEIISDYYNCC
jgi:hypothetical protein